MANDCGEKSSRKKLFFSGLISNIQSRKKLVLHPSILGLDEAEEVPMTKTERMRDALRRDKRRRHEACFPFLFWQRTWSWLVVFETTIDILWLSTELCLFVCVISLTFINWMSSYWIDHDFQYIIFHVERAIHSYHDERRGRSWRKLGLGKNLSSNFGPRESWAKKWTLSGSFHPSRVVNLAEARQG